MEDERNTQYPQAGESQEKSADQVEVKDRGFMDTILGRKKPEEQEKKEEEALAAGMENVKVSEEPAKHEDKKEEEHHGGEKKESLLAKLHRTSSSSSSSSEEEEEVIDDNGEVVKRKKKKGLKEKIKEKLPGGHKEPGAEAGEHKPHVPAPAPPAAPVETHAHKVDDDHKAYIPATAPATTTGTTAHVHQDDNAVVVQKVEETPEKGLLEKIKEKLPGGPKKPEDATAAAAPPAEDVSSPDGKEKKQGLLGKIMDKIPGYHKSPAEEEHKPTTAADEHKTSS